MNVPDHREVVVEENNEVEDVFAVLPTELLSHILLDHLHPLWHLVCKHVCHRWRNLLLAQPMQRDTSLPGVGDAAALARGGHWEVLQWAISQGCPWSKWTCTVQLVEAI